MDFRLSRRAVMAGLGASLLVDLRAMAQGLTLPTSPIELNIVDVAGNLQLTQRAIETYRDAHPNLISRINFSKAPSPELPGKIKAQQDAGRLDIDGVLTGIDAIAAGAAMDMWVPIANDFAATLPKLQDIYLDGAWAMQQQANGQGVCVTFCDAGPVINYNPAKVQQVPKTAAELLVWAAANPGRFMYARPANSGPGRIFMMGLPYLLGDKDPKDPENGWEKTWAYLQELGKYVDYYPSGTGPVFKELGEGSRDMIPSQAGWDINTRALGVVPKETAVFFLDGFHWVMDAHYLCLPRGIPDEKLAVMVDMLIYLLSPEAQAMAYDSGYFYPGPAVKDVPLSMAPADSQAILAEFGRPEYADIIANNSRELPLAPDRLIRAFARWDELVGSNKVKK